MVLLGGKKFVFEDGKIVHILYFVRPVEKDGFGVQPISPKERKGYTVSPELFSKAEAFNGCEVNCSFNEYGRLVDLQ